MSLNSLANNEYRHIERLGEIREEIHYVQNHLYYVDYVAGIKHALDTIAQRLVRPNLWQRLRLRLFNWWFRRRLARGIPQKEWNEKTREALADFEKRLETEPAKWQSVWR